MPSKSKTNPTPTSITKTPTKHTPENPKTRTPPQKPQETMPANISSVRKAPDPGRLLTKDPHPLPGGCLLPSLAPRCSARSGCAPSRFARPPLPAPSSRFLLCSHSSASPPPLPAPRRPPPARLLSPPSSSIRPSPSPPGQTDQNYPISPHHPNTPKIPLPATIHVLNIYE